MRNKEDLLQEGTRLLLPSGSLYEITGEPIGAGGGSVVYPACRLIKDEDSGELKRSRLMFAIKECFPDSIMYRYHRSENREIVPLTDNDAARAYLEKSRKMLLSEAETSQRIYLKGSRVLPVQETAVNLTLTVPGGAPTGVSTTITVMESLSEKGLSLTSHVRALNNEGKHFHLATAFEVLRQVLFALREIHEAHYLHLDIQSGNVFVRGTLEDESDIVTLIDFGSARPMEADGRTAPVSDKLILTTQGYSAPEISIEIL